MGEHDESTEIGAKLVVDDHASEAVEHLKEHFEKLHEGVGEVTHELGEFVKQSLAVAAGFEIDRGLGGLESLGEEAFHATQSFESTNKALTGLLTMNDKAGKSFGDLSEDARELHENLEGMAVDLGASSEATVDAFEMVAARSQKTTDEVKEMVGQMAYAGRAVPGGLDQIASAYRDLEAGIIRPRNAIVQLIKQTGTAGGSVKDIAKGMQAMMEHDPSKAFALADQAIGRMSEKMKNAPLGFGEIVNSLKDVREQLFVALGEPMLRQMLGPLTDLRRYLVEHKEELGKMAEMLGEKVGEWVKESAHLIEQGFEYLRDHATEISNAIHKGVNAAREVIEFILAHKEEIAVAFGAKTAVGAYGAGANAFGELKKTLDGIKGLSAGGAPSIGMQGGTLLSAATLAAASAAAVLAWGEVVRQVEKLSAETEGFKSDAERSEEARMRKLQEMAMAGQTKGIEHLVDMTIEADASTHGLATALRDLAYANERANVALEKGETQGFDVAEAQQKSGAGGLAAKAFYESFQGAMEFGNKSVEKYGATFLTTHKAVFASLIDAMKKTGVDVTGVASELAAQLTAIGATDMAKQLAPFSKAKGEVPNAMTMNFPGAQFTIKQDFASQDPDAVALIFRRDIARSATLRLQSKFGPAFGL